MSTEQDLKLPLIDLNDYINPQLEEDRERVITEVRSACAEFGFFQAKGHGIPLNVQQDVLQSIDALFDMPTEEKLKLSFLNNKCRRGYEASGMVLRDHSKLPDSKEAFYIGREDSEVEYGGFFGPNVWPPLPEHQFRQPVWKHYQATQQLCETVLKILLEGLGHPVTLLEAFTQRPMVVMRMLRYPPPAETLPGQFGVGAHTDFGGVTALLQQPDRDGLEVWVESKKQWIPVQAMEDVYVINCGDMTMRWSGGRYKSARHRVINKAIGRSRVACATFYDGDLFATNPLNPDDPNKETVGQLFVKRFDKQFSLEAEMEAAVGTAA